MEEIDVLKCHRPLKSCVIFASVWCSFRSNAWSAGPPRRP